MKTDPSAKSAQSVVYPSPLESALGLVQSFPRGGGLKLAATLNTTESYAAGMRIARAGRLV